MSFIAIARTQLTVSGNKFPAITLIRNLKRDTLIILTRESSGTAQVDKSELSKSN